MRVRGDGFETYHLTCMVCGALPGTTCLDEDYQELAWVHPSRRVSIEERNRRFSNGWEPPEIAERRRRRKAEEIMRAPLFDPRLGSGVVAIVKGQGVTGRRPPRAANRRRRGTA